MDYCKFFQDIEADPTAMTPRLTVRQYEGAKKHLQNCDNCNVRVNKVLAQAPKTNTFLLSGDN